MTGESHLDFDSQRRRRSKGRKGSRLQPMGFLRRATDDVHKPYSLISENSLLTVFTPSIIHVYLFYHFILLFNFEYCFFIYPYDDTYFKDYIKNLHYSFWLVTEAENSANSERLGLKKNKEIKLWENNIVYGNLTCWLDHFWAFFPYARLFYGLRVTVWILSWELYGCNTY